MKKNTALAKMRAGKPALGASAGLGSPLAAEMLSLMGYDFVLVDNQHGVWDDDTTMQAFHMICLGEAVPMARVRGNDFTAIGRLLDRGAMGIVVPLVNSRADAETAAYAMRYPPRGGRSKGPLGASFLGRDYLDRANEEVFLAVQIESITAVEHAEEILSVDGVDGCWIGPSDLAATMGLSLSTQKERDEHLAAIMRVLEACKKTGKIPGIAGGLNGRPWIERGFLFVTCAGDSAYIAREGPKTLEELAEFRS
ncbi:MAG: 2-dehydro-3-deoxyglucarate aldolase [Chloroflexi bacterium]|nr:2-dehydro-3-deoxyglucarate aldolase [Chloroflexota bacterium]